MQPLSPRQMQVLEILQRHTKAGLHGPISTLSVRDVMRALGIASVSTAHDHLMALERKGYIKRLPNRRILIKQGVPVA